MATRFAAKAMAHFEPAAGLATEAESIFQLEAGRFFGKKAVRFFRQPILIIGLKSLFLIRINFCHFRFRKDIGRVSTPNLALGNGFYIVANPLTSF